MVNFDIPGERYQISRGKRKAKTTAITQAFVAEYPLEDSSLVKLDHCFSEAVNIEFTRMTSVSNMVARDV